MKQFALGIIAIGIAMAHTGCRQQFIYRTNYLETVESRTLPPTDGIPGDEVYEVVVSKPAKWLRATVTDNGEYLAIEPDDTTAPLQEIARVRLRESLRYDDDYVFAGHAADAEPDRFRSVFKYGELKPVFQAITVGLKIRPALTEAALLDSFPSTAETDFNLGIAGGVKFGHNIYESQTNIFGQNTKTYSFALCAFVGLGVAGLTTDNTRNPVITFERDAPMISTGGVAMVGLYSVNIGYAFGVDFATGPGATTWLYQGKGWHGIIVGLDVIN